MRVLVCGDRNWDDYIAILQTLTILNHNSGIECIIEGEAHGADEHSRIAGEALNITVLRFPANWELHGKAAGPVRNQQMLDVGKPDIVLAFHDKLHESKGTKDMIGRAKLRSIPVIHYFHSLSREEL